MRRFQEWLVLKEIGETQIEKRLGKDVFSNPAMEAAMYMAYRAAYDPITQKDSNDPNATAWSHGEWTKPASGGTRAPAWTFYGSFPTEQELAVISQELKNKGNVETTVNSLLKTNPGLLNNVGGITYRIRGDGLKITGSYGVAKIPKMTALAHLTHEANEQGLQIFLGVDKELKDMLDASSKLMPKLHQKGIVPTPQLAIAQPPKEVMPLLYNMVSQSDLAKGSGDWKGYNPETGAFQFQLSGSGLRDKYIYANKHLWQKQINSVLGPGVMANPMLKPMIATYANSAEPVPPMVVNMVNKTIKSKMPDAPPLGQEGVKWLLQQVS